MKKAVSHVWERLVAFICVLTLTASYLPAMPVFAESINGYSTEIYADKSEADVGEEIEFQASIKFDPEHSTDEEKEDFSFVWYVNDENKADGDTYELKVDSLDGDSKEYEVYFGVENKKRVVTKLVEDGKEVEATDLMGTRIMGMFMADKRA